MNNDTCPSCGDEVKSGKCLNCDEAADPEEGNEETDDGETEEDE